MLFIIHVGSHPFPTKFRKTDPRTEISPRLVYYFRRIFCIELHPRHYRERFYSYILLKHSNDESADLEMEIIKRRKLNEEGLGELQPLKVLLICSQPLLDDEYESQTLHLPDLKEERTKISQIFKDSGIEVRLHILAEATLAEVALALQKPWDIVHFTGIHAIWCPFLTRGSSLRPIFHEFWLRTFFFLSRL
jgi:hypothetical protein